MLRHPRMSRSGGGTARSQADIGKGDRRAELVDRPADLRHWASALLRSPSKDVVAVAGMIGSDTVADQQSSIVVVPLGIAPAHCGSPYSFMLSARQKSGLSACGTAEFVPGYQWMFSAQIT